MIKNIMFVLTFVNELCCRHWLLIRKHYLQLCVGFKSSSALRSKKPSDCVFCAVSVKGWKTENQKDETE